MPSYPALAAKKAELIRKATDGSLFIGEETAALITTLTTGGATPTLSALPTGMKDGGWFTTDGVQMGRDVTSSSISSFGSTSPTRSDVTGDTDTLTVGFQETNIVTLGLSTGGAQAGITSTALTGEVHIKKPLAAAARVYRVFGLFVDQGAGGDIWMGRYLPRAKVTAFGAETYSQGDEAILRGVTFTGEPDSVYGSAGGWLFGGPGWKALLTQMGIPAAA